MICDIPGLQHGCFFGKNPNQIIPRMFPFIFSFEGGSRRILRVWGRFLSWWYVTSLVSNVDVFLEKVQTREFPRCSLLYSLLKEAVWEFSAYSGDRSKKGKTLLKATHQGGCSAQKKGLNFLDFFHLCHALNSTKGSSGSELWEDGKFGFYYFALVFQMHFAN